MPKDDKGWKQLEEIIKNISIRDVGWITLRLHRRITKRAFPMTSSAKGSDGGRFPGLSPDYKDYKTGRKRYKSEATKARAMGRRKKTGGSPITGPYVEGRRLGKRKGFPNNQLTGKTGQNFQAKAEKRFFIAGEKRGKLFFTDRGKVGASLENRKPWIRPTEEEFSEAQSDLSQVINEQVKDLPKDLITFDLGTMTLGK
jgi:hypothetical protein